MEPAHFLPRGDDELGKPMSRQSRPRSSQGTVAGASQGTAYEAGPRPAIAKACAFSSAGSAHSSRTLMADTPPPPRRRLRPDSPIPVDSPRTLSVRSIDSESTAAWGGVEISVAEETGTAPEDYFCQICLEAQRASAGFALTECGHAFCRACLKAYVTSKINDGQVHLTCFYNAGDDRSKASEETGVGGETPQAGACSVAIDRGDVEALLASDRKARRKYERFLFCREHETARECPRCTRLQVGDPLVAEMRCNRCGARFCYHHGGAHEGKTCEEYCEATAEENDRTQALINRLTKLCPGCKTPVEKVGGCNQMNCYHCSASFCWICGQEVDRGTFPVHFQWWNVKGCPNQQLQENAPPSGGGRRCLQILSVAQILIVGPLALLLTVASSLACLCCLPAFKLSPRQLLTGCFSGWGNFVMMLPILPFLLVAAVVAAVVFVVLLPFRLASEVGRKYLLSRAHGHAAGREEGSAARRQTSFDEMESGFNGGRRGGSGVEMTGAGLGATTTEPGSEVGVEATDEGTEAPGSASSPASPLAGMFMTGFRQRQEQRRASAQLRLQQERRRADPSALFSSTPSSSAGVAPAPAASSNWSQFRIAWWTGSGPEEVGASSQGDVRAAAGRKPPLLLPPNSAAAASPPSVSPLHPPSGLLDRRTVSGSGFGLRGPVVAREAPQELSSGLAADGVVAAGAEGAPRRAEDARFDIVAATMSMRDMVGLLLRGSPGGSLPSPRATTTAAAAADDGAGAGAGAGAEAGAEAATVGGSKEETQLVP